MDGVTEVILQTHIDEYMVSTIELKDWYDEYVFETMVFQKDVGHGGHCGDHPDYETDRHTTKEDALEYHKELCIKIYSDKLIIQLAALDDQGDE